MPSRKVALRLDSRELRAHALSGLADAQYLDCRMATALELFSQCVELNEAAGLRRILTANRVMMGHCRIYLSAFDAGVDEMGRGLEVAAGLAIGKRAAIGFERLPPAAGVKLEIADLQGEVDTRLLIGCDGQSAARKRDRLVLPEEGLLIFRCCEVGASRFGVGREIKMLGPEGWLPGQRVGGSAVKLSPPRTCERRIDAVSHQSMHELKSVRRTPQERVAQQDFGGVARVVDQPSQRRKRESLAEGRRGLDGAPVVGREQIGAGEDDALNAAWQLPVDEIAGGPQKLFKKERVAAGALDAFRREFLSGREAAGDGLRLGRRGRS